jgi:protoporphyrinogen oxidase
MENTDVAIIGAGLAGLSAAVHLTKAGKKVIVFEANDYIGGKVSTEYVDGFALDRGFQVFLTSYPEALKELDYKKLQLQPFSPSAQIYYQGKIEKLPAFHDYWYSVVKMCLFSKLISLKDIYSFIKLSLKIKNQNAYDTIIQEKISALEVLKKAGFSQGLIDLFFKPFLGGILLDKSLESSGQMVNFLMKMFLEGATALPSHGMSAIPEQLAMQLPELTVRLNKRLHKINLDGELLFDDQSRFKSKDVLIATDPWSAAKLLDLPLPPPGHNVAVQYFSAEKSPIDDPSLFLFADTGPVNHLAVLSDVSANYAPAGAHLISATILNDYLYLDDEELTQGCLDQLGKVFGDQVKEWKPVKLMRIQNAQPSLYPDRIWHTSFPYKVKDHLFACGDYLEMPSIDSALRVGRLAAEDIIRSSAKDIVI